MVYRRSRCKFARVVCYAELTDPIQHPHLSSHLAPRTRVRVPRAAPPAVWPVPTPTQLSPAPQNGPHTRTPSPPPCKPFHTLLFPGVYAWYCVSAIGNAHTPTPGANANTTGRRYRPPSVAAHALLRWLLQPSLELALLTTAPDSNNGLQVLYTTQELATDFLKDPELTSAWPKRDIMRAVGKQAALGSSVTVLDLGPS